MHMVLTVGIWIHWQLDMWTMHILSLGRLPIINTVCCWTLPEKQLCSPSSIMHQIFSLYCRSIWSAEGSGSEPYWFYPAGATTPDSGESARSSRPFIAEVTLEAPVKTISHVLWREAYCHCRERSVALLDSFSLTATIWILQCTAWPR